MIPVLLQIRPLDPRILTLVFKDEPLSPDEWDYLRQREEEQGRIEREEQLLIDAGLSPEEIVEVFAPSVRKEGGA